MISVLIPTYNEEKIIESTLAQFDALAGSWQLIVCDGGSTDKTPVKVKRLEKAEFVRSEEGRGCAIRKGFGIARAEICLILHADVKLPANAYEVILKHLQKKPVGAFRVRTQADAPGSWFMKKWLWFADLRSKFTSIPYGDQALFFKKEVWGKAGEYSVSPFMDDWLFARAIRRYYGPIRSLPEFVRVSGRRMERSPVKYLLVMLFFPSLLRLGLSPQRMAGVYKPER